MCLDNKSWKVVKCQNLIWTYIFLMARRMASDDVIIAQIWMSQLGVNLAWRWYLFRFEISTPADEFDIHRPQAPRPAYLFYRPSLRWDWSCFVEDSGLRATDFAPLGVFNVDPSVCLLEHLWLSCAVAQWGIKTQVCSRRKIFKGSECPMMYFVSLNLVLFGTPESQQSRSEVYPKASFNSPWSHTLDFLCFIITFHSSPWDHEYQIGMVFVDPLGAGKLWWGTHAQWGLRSRKQVVKFLIPRRMATILPNLGFIDLSSHESILLNKKQRMLQEPGTHWGPSSGCLWSELLIQRSMLRWSMSMIKMSIESNVFICKNTYSDIIYTN